MKTWQRNLVMTAAVLGSAMILAAAMRAAGDYFWGAFLCNVLAGFVIGLNLRLWNLPP